MTEQAYTDRIVDLAHTYGWTAAHFRPARTKTGWRTACAYDAEGFPDLVLVHPTEGVVYVEVKAEKGRLSIEQERWLRNLSTAGADACAVWPKDWPMIVELLSGGRAAA